MTATKKPTYVEIIDNGMRQSTLHHLNTMWLSSTMETLANKDEWSKHNYYPKNGHVGEVIHELDVYTYILKIDNKILVPISKAGYV